MGFRGAAQGFRGIVCLFVYSLKVLKNEKYRFVKEQLVVDFELLN